MKTAVLGIGRMAQAVRRLWPEDALGAVAAAEAKGPDLEAVDIVIGALAGGQGPVALEQALEHGTDLIDLADLETEVYEERRQEIAERGITVIPAAGLSPGLVTLLVGHELARGRVREVEVMAGSLSPEPHFFPFLWCFEDMVAELEGPSIQLERGVEQSFPADAGYRREDVLGIAAESTLGQSGFENLARVSGVESFTYRNLRPRGFGHFFRFLHGHGAFEPEWLASTKALLESRAGENLSLARVSASTATGRRSWQVVARAGAESELSSMQQVTASYVIEMARLIAGRRAGPGLVWSEDLGHDAAIVGDVLDAIRGRGVLIELDEKGGPHA